MLSVQTFADIPAEIKRRIEGGERVLLVLLDAFGLEFLERHRDHPLVQRLSVQPLRAQFPSTTTVHVTTMAFGLPVQEHGLYEWHVLEPALDTMICPLRFALAASEMTDELVGRLDPLELVPGETVYERLAVGSLVAQPGVIAGSAFTRLATRGAEVVGVESLGAGVRAGLDALRGGFGYANVYWDAVDGVGHRFGPSSPEFAARSRAVLDELWAELRAVRDVTVLLTADHGQIDVDPSRVDYVDDLWPELTELLTQPQPAGSSRDMFLHVGAEHVDHVIAELAVRLEGRASVRRAESVFASIGPRLQARLGDVLVLPAPGHQVWLRSAAANETWFRGHHGGLEEVETSTYLAELSV
ncbi:MAG TPA: alkaline phosphatase family protein [Solirubrobacteraceae bacterium]|nr:alkaline phosphatase family protein [Solirubrobacteraceae bacterium]